MVNKCYICHANCNIGRQSGYINVHCNNCNPYKFRTSLERKANLLYQTTGKESIIDTIKGYYQKQNSKHPDLCNLDQLLEKAP